MSKLSRSKLDPGTMKEPNPSHDLEQTILLETFGRDARRGPDRAKSQKTTPGREYEADPRLTLRSVACFCLFFHWLLPSSFRVRNSFSDSSDITVKTITDLAKIRKSHVAFAAFNFIKIGSLQSAPFTKLLLLPT